MKTEITIKTAIAIQYRPSDRETLVGIYWKIFPRDNSEEFAVIRLPESAGNNTEAEYRAVLATMEILSEWLARNNIRKKRVNLEIIQGNFTLAEQMAGFILPPANSNLCRLFHQIRNTSAGFRSVRIIWMEKKNNPAFRDWKEWIRKENAFHS